MKKSNTGLLIAILSVGVLILVALTLNLAMGGMWVVKGLDGETGRSAYELAVENGFTGSVTEWLASLGGSNGKSAYEIAVANGFEGSEKEWLISLAFGENGKDGRDGADGHDGEDGRNGRDGEDGKDGKDGVSIRSVQINGSGHLIVYLTDGTQVDAGYIGNSIASAEVNDFTRAQTEENYKGTLSEWLRELQTGLKKDASGAALSVSDCWVNENGHLMVLLSDEKTTLDAGQIPADGYLSETVEQYNMHPRFEMVVLNWENPALNLRTAPDTGSPLQEGGYAAGTEFLCIGRGEVTEGDEFCMVLLADGRVGYARSKFFEAKHTIITGAEGLNLPDSLLLTVGKPMRLVGTEMVPWADDSCLLSMEGDGLTVTADNGIFTLSCSTAGTYTLQVTLFRPLSVGVQLLDSRQITVTVANSKALSGKKGLLIGDSRINPGTGISASLPKSLTALLPGVTWLGTQTTPSGVACEGFGGWSAANFLSSQSVKGVSNPFYDPDTKGFDFAYYIGNHADCKPDFVILNLGANDLYSARSVGYLDQLVRSIHAYDPELPVLVLTEYTRRPGSAAYASDVTRRLSAAYFNRLSAVFAGKESERTYLIPNFLSVDPDGDRADAVHLSADGYTHEANVIVTYLTDLLGS